MAEGWLRHLAGGRYQAHSAGLQATGVREPAIGVMAEAGVDISRHESKTLERYHNQLWDVVITVCDEAEACPVLPSAKTRLHWSIQDPAAATGSDAERMAVYRRVRDELRAKIAAWLAGDAGAEPAP